MVEVGGAVVYVDEHARERAALCTAIHGDPEKNPSINLVLVSIDEAMTDPYGRQMGRETSIVHESDQSAHGNYYRL